MLKQVVIHHCSRNQLALSQDALLLINCKDIHSKGFDLVKMTTYQIMALLLIFISTVKPFILSVVLAFKIIDDLIGVIMIFLVQVVGNLNQSLDATRHSL